MDSLPQNDSHVKTNCQQDGVDRAFRSAFGDRAISVKLTAFAGEGR